MAVTECQEFKVTFAIGHYGVGYTTWDGQLVLGLGMRTATMTLAEGLSNTDLVQFTGSGLEGGMLLRLDDQPWRLGIAGRMEVQSADISGPAVTEMGDVQQVEGFVLPTDVFMPWEVQVGFAWQFGRRPLNRPWIHPWDAERAIVDPITVERGRRQREQAEREIEAEGRPLPAHDPYAWMPRRARDEQWWEEEYRRRALEDVATEQALEEAEEERTREARQLSRLYVLVSAEVLIVGPTTDGVGVEGFFGQQRIRSGEDPTIGFRLGAEVEPWGNRLKLRAGGYLEPSRFGGVGYRIHGTAGLDFRLFTWDLFGWLDDFDVRVGANADIAERYFDWGVGVGFWH
jgi:hypothetical protein